MERKQIKNYTKSVIEEIKGVQYNEDLFDKQLGELNMDSISFIKMLVKLELEFDITFGEEVILINQDTTINYIIDCIGTIMDSQMEVVDE
ncbi:phosphopantetheine-binding protein [Anaerosporobacter faecicola]|uniref:phosphopantetheine-binding protein n=1 Tax=Anaerosporobacter faecicola TaxID=2718714 RepID=UPI00143B0ABE|nr:phosphopantetheine-binding protein [Anaerosporobacter faecicola]